MSRDALDLGALDSVAPPSFPSEQAYACALDALAARKSALLFVSDGCEGTCFGTGILVRPDGTAVTQAWMAATDGPIAVDGLTIRFLDLATSGEECTLRAPEFDAACNHGPEGDCDMPSEWFASYAPLANRACGAE